MGVKGAGMGGCCCGGCHVVPVDIRLPSTALQPIQRLCCACIPLVICVTVTHGGDDHGRSLFWRCQDTTFTGDPILYSGQFIIDGKSTTINIRFGLGEGDSCALTWDMPELGLTGSRLIDHAEPAYDPTKCVEQPQAGCCEFGGTWEVEHSTPFTFQIAPSPTLSLECDGGPILDCDFCRCVCESVCFDIWRNSGDLYTWEGAAKIVPGEIIRDIGTVCDGRVTIREPPVVRWVNGDWMLELGGSFRRYPRHREILTGVEAVDTCGWGYLIHNPDGESHTIDEETDPQAAPVVIYEWELDDEIALRLQWAGRSYGQTSMVELHAYNWVTLAWDLLADATGRPDGITANHLIHGLQLDSDYTGTGGNLGKVRVRLTTDGATSLSTDNIELHVSGCCHLSVIPPYGIEQPAPIKIAYPDECPDIRGKWEWFSGLDYYTVTVECSWCDANCGSVAVPCCNRPLPATLTAVVDMGCADGCGDVTIPLFVNAGTGLWSGSGIACGDTLPISLGCSGDAVNPVWDLDVGPGVGACAFNPPDADEKDCDPLRLVFSGNYAGGIGCCGTGGGITTTWITVTITE